MHAVHNILVHGGGQLFWEVLTPGGYYPGGICTVVFFRVYVS